MCKVYNPISTVTNGAYILLGYVALPFYLGWFLIGLGIVSAGFHWTRRNGWHKADIVGIYYVFAVITGHILFGDMGTLTGLAVGAVAHWSFTDYSRYSTMIIGSLGLCALGADWYMNGFTDMLRPLGWFTKALIFGMIARKYEGSAYPIVYDTLHGIWHIDSAVGIWQLMR